VKVCLLAEPKDESQLASPCVTATLSFSATHHCECVCVEGIRPTSGRIQEVSWGFHRKIFFKAKSAVSWKIPFLWVPFHSVQNVTG
jgi:hypothetical protein